MKARQLTESDAPALTEFLTRYKENSLFLLSNMERSGMVVGDEPYKGQYWGAFDDERMVGALALYWNGMVIPSAPEGKEALADLLVREANRPIAGFVGERQQVDWLADRLGDGNYRLNSPEKLYALDLDKLVEPELLTDPTIECRLGREDDIPTLVAWRAAYDVELMGAEPGEENNRKALGVVSADVANGVSYVLTRDGEPMSMSVFNARVDEMVQVGGVYTPPECRRLGYARAVVAGSLLIARQKGARRSILFTGFDNLAAQRAYQALGYQPIGEFAIKVLNRD